MCNKESASVRSQFLQTPKGTAEMDHAPGDVGVSPMRARDAAWSLHTSPNASRCNFAKSMLSSWVSIFRRHTVAEVYHVLTAVFVRFVLTQSDTSNTFGSRHKCKWRRRNAKRACHVPSSNITSYGLALLEYIFGDRLPSALLMNVCENSKHIVY